MISKLAIVALVCATASADDDLAAQGEALAKAGDYSRAIDAFKAADKQKPSTRNACMIGLAYLRREAWPQAELFLATCKQRASAADPAPEWVPAAEQQLAEKLAAANVAPVEVTVTPASATASVTVSSFALDESFNPPRTLHLAPGRHTFEVQADGFATTSKTITISDRQAQHVTVELVAAGAVQPARPEPETSSSAVPYIVMGSGAAIGVAALIFGLTVVKSERDDLASTQDLAHYNDLKDKFVLRRDLAFAAGGVAVATIAVGAILKFTVYKHDETAVAVAPTAGGGMVTFASSF
ncbi:MAG: PEGA domain-containing protein [Kofleriaceae bacterium]